jgi:hypothetical protein
LTVEKKSLNEKFWNNAMVNNNEIIVQQEAKFDALEAK